MRKLVVAVVLAAVMFGGMGTGVAFAHPDASDDGISGAEAAGAGAPVGSHVFGTPGWDNGVGNPDNNSGNSIIARNPLCPEHPAPGDH